MSIADRLKNAYLRIDARSLGLFRIAMGLALIGDWCMRWSDSRAFYSNDGVVPNHAHLFYALRQNPPVQVWSLFHSVSSPGEAVVGLLLTLIVYCLFLVGHKTRVFHVLSLVMLVSLTGRNVFLEGPANYVAIALLAATVFLPCGSRFSVDALRDSFKRRDEKDAVALNDRSRPSEAVLAAERGAGWSPLSFAALAVLLQICVIFYATARQQSGGQWHDGTALHYALWVERWVSDLGMALRAAPQGLLRAWSYVLRFTPFAVPILILVPIPRFGRAGAFVLMVFYGVSYGLLFSFGLWGWSFAAAACLVLSTENWDAFLARSGKRRALSVIYDADCGICLWLARLLKRLDLYGRVTLQGNDTLTVLAGQKPPYRSAGDETERVLYRRLKADAKVETIALPAEISDELAGETVVAVDEDGKVFTRGRAVTAVVRALPFGSILSLPLRIPGISHLLDALYRFVAPRRFAISESFGMAACGIPIRADEAASGEPGTAEEAAAKTLEVAPSTRARRTLTAALREGGAAVLFVATLAQTAKSNPWPALLTVPQVPALAAITGWSRMQARYDVIAPEAPTEDGVFVVDGQTNAGKAVDPMTGKEPVLDVPRFRLGLLWSTFTARIRKKESADFEKTFRDYLAKGGPGWQGEGQDNRITGFDAYWLTYKSPPPGVKAVEITGRDKLFTHSRGGRGAVPVIKAPLLR